MKLTTFLGVALVLMCSHVTVYGAGIDRERPKFEGIGEFRDTVKLSDSEISKLIREGEMEFFSPGPKPKRRCFMYNGGWACFVQCAHRVSSPEEEGGSSGACQ